MALGSAPTSPESKEHDPRVGAQAQGDHREAARLLGEALDLYGSESAGFEVGRTRLALAELAHAQGDRDAASRQLQEAYRLFAALAVPRYLARAEAMAKEFRLPL